MIEPVFMPRIVAGDLLITPGVSPAEPFAREKASLWRATALAVENALTHGMDFPVGAVALEGNDIVGRFYASDQRTGYGFMHAEHRARADAAMSEPRAVPDLLGVTLEPCDNCQDNVCSPSSVKTVPFVLSRQNVADMGLVKPHTRDVFDRAEAGEIDFEPIQIIDPRLTAANMVILNNVMRDPVTEAVSCDVDRMRAQLLRLPEFYQFR